MGEWIRFSERKPDEGQLVWVMYEGVCEGPTCYLPKEPLSPSTAWMPCPKQRAPLPELPEGWRWETYGGAKLLVARLVARTRNGTCRVSLDEGGHLFVRTPDGSLALPFAVIDAVREAKR